EKEISQKVICLCRFLTISFSFFFQPDKYLRELLFIYGRGNKGKIIHIIRLHYLFFRAFEALNAVVTEYTARNAGKIFIGSIISACYFSKLGEGFFRFSFP